MIQKMNISEKLDYIRGKAKKSPTSNNQLVQDIMHNTKNTVVENEGSLRYASGCNCCCDDDGGARY